MNAFPRLSQADEERLNYLVGEHDKDVDRRQRRLRWRQFWNRWRVEVLMTAAFFLMLAICVGIAIGLDSLMKSGWIPQ